MDKNRGTYFNTEAKFWNWLSSQLRKTWRDHPTRLDFIKAKRFVKFVGNRPIFHLECNHCHKAFPLKAIEINHLVKCGNIKEDGYALRLYDVGFDEMEALCKPCHAVVTYSERSGLSLEDSRIEKDVIAFAKLPAAQQKGCLRADSKAKNAKERKDEYRAYLKSNI